MNFIRMSRGKVKKDWVQNTLIGLANKHVEQAIEEGEQLLPGVPDDVTLGQIVPKLPWTAFYILSSVSHGWRRAIRSRQVYDARVRSKSTQTLIALSDPSKDITQIALFSTKDGSCYRLPPIPGVKKGIPWECGCISLDGKLYVFGGLLDSSFKHNDGSVELYVLDLAGQRRWKQCASMKDARYGFNYGVKDGKIYVFAGGSFTRRRAWASEVYDPQEDVWSPIAPVPSFRFHAKVTTVGDELFVHSGLIGIPEWTPSRSRRRTKLEHIADAVSAEVYDPHKDGWRTLKDFTQSRQDKVLVLGGKLHKLNQDGIEVYDTDQNSWQQFQPISFGPSEPDDFSIVEVLGAVVVDDEVLAAVYWTMLDNYEGTCLIKSQGVRGKYTEIVWQRLKCSIPVNSSLPLLCPVQL